MSPVKFLLIRLGLGVGFVAVPITFLAIAIKMGWMSRILDIIIIGMVIAFILFIVTWIGHQIRRTINKKTRGYPYKLKEGNFVIDANDIIWKCEKIDKSPWNTTPFGATIFKFYDTPDIANAKDYNIKLVKGEDTKGYMIIDPLDPKYTMYTKRWAEHNLLES